MWWSGMPFGGVAIFGLLIFIAFWVAVIWLIIWAIRKFLEGRGSSAGKSALEIAKERYARGEITKEQFEQLKKDLS